LFSDAARATGGAWMIRLKSYRQFKWQRFVRQFFERRGGAKAKYMNTDWTLAAMVEVILVIQAWLGTVQAGSWLAPGAFYSILWASFVGSSLIFAPDYKI
jgi:hypothetical protein